jgi:predicted dehydrogenase/threonine dehydrogenase-like Zn-dependent dehydrogenase
MKDGELRTVDVPAPELDDWKVLVRTYASLVSAGTERAKVDLARASLIGKARRRPDQVRQVLEKVRTDGLGATIDAVRNRLEALSPLGYCAAGRVERVGARVRDIRPGDLVACGGEEAAHAALIAVPGNLCAKLPDKVEPEAAAFATLGSIALHGFRQGELQLGERVAVVGMGLVGQLAARIAHAAGCYVLGIDLESWRLELAKRAGALSEVRMRPEIAQEDEGRWDVVLVTAAAPTASDPVSLATDLARERGRIVVVGDVRLELDRRRLYAKELEVRLARSYGPGRYDREYEERGLDYPIGYVRWTERRNMAAFLDLLGKKKVRVDDLITHRFAIEEAARGFEVLTRPEERALAVVIEYAGSSAGEDVAPSPPSHEPRTFVAGHGVGFIGAGSFARRELIPLAKRHGLMLERVATASGLSAASAAQQFGFRRGACSVAELLGDNAISGVLIATRHDRHADLTLAALRAGKAVFVEKPLCLTEGELDELRVELARADAPPFVVGFNRRFAPHTAALREHLAGATGPTNIALRVSAGPLSRDHWLNDPAEGGGRLLGEGCHFVDLILDLVGTDPIGVTTVGWSRPDEPLQSTQDFAVSIRFTDGSLGVLVYGTAGSPKAGKELVEAHRGQRSGRIEDFRILRLWGAGRTRTHRARRRDKGHSAELLAFARAVRGEAHLPPASSYLASTAVTFAALRSLETGHEESIEPAEVPRRGEVAPPSAESAGP